MEWLTNLAQNTDTPVLAALALGLLTAVSPCPLATNITATSYIARTINSRKLVVLSGLLYTLGRIVSYTTLGILVYFGASKFEVARIFQGNGEKAIGPLMILIGLVMLGVLKLNFLSKGTGITERLSERFKDKGLLGSFLLGAVFALAFCPYSGALFFAMLMPLMLSADAGLAIPVVFSIATGLPVLFFAVIIAYSIEKLGIYFRAIKQTEKVMRTVAGIVFILTGVYYININFKLI